MSGAYLASNSAVGANQSDSVTVSGTGFTGATDILLGIVVPGPSGVLAISWPSGFSLLTNVLYSGANGNASYMSVGWGTTVAGSYVINVTGGDLTTPAAIGVAFSGTNGTQPSVFSATTDAGDGNSPLSVGLSSITPSSAAGAIAWIAALNYNSLNGTYSWTAPSGYTSRQSQSVASATGISSSGGAIHVSTRDNVPAGATGTITGTATQASQTFIGSMGVAVWMGSPSGVTPAVPLGGLPRVQMHWR